MLILASLLTSLFFATYQKFTIVAANRRGRWLWRSWFLIACGVAVFFFGLAIVTTYRRLRCGFRFLVACLVAVVVCRRTIITADWRFGLRFFVTSSLTLFV